MSTYINLHNDFPGTPNYYSGDLDLLESRLAEHGCTLAARWEVIVHHMDNDVREQVHGELAPCTEREFLDRYLELATEPLVIG